MTSTTTTSSVVVDELLRGRADRHKPTYSELRDEGVSQRAIELLHEGRDMLALGRTPYAFAVWLHAIAPLATVDLFPDGKPEHWEVWDEEHGYSRPADYDPTDAELEAAWNSPTAPEAHRAAWALHQELHDRSAS